MPLGQFARAVERWVARLSDPQLYALLHHPTTRAYGDFSVDGFKRSRAEYVRVPVQQSWVSVQPAGSKRLRPSGLESSELRLFDWADIRLPSLTRLRFVILDFMNAAPVMYIGGATFITAHTALLTLEVTLLLVSVAELTATFKTRPHYLS